MAQTDAPPPGDPSPSASSPSAASSSAASAAVTPPAAPPRAAAVPRPAAPKPERDWTTEAADRIEAVVSAVRDKTTRPVQKIAAVVVYGVVAAVAGIAAVILLIVGLLRFVQVYLPYHPEGRRVWTAYLALGAIFCVVGALCWRLRRATSKG